MAVRKLYGSLDSLSTMRALASLFEHQVEFEFIPVDLDNDKLSIISLNVTPPYFLLSHGACITVILFFLLTIVSSEQPFGELPVFQDGDLTLFGKISHTLSSPAL